MQFLLVFLAMVATDFVWARYNIASINHRPVAAGLYSAAIVALGAYSVVSYTQNHWMWLPAAAGAFVGTFFAVR